MATVEQTFREDRDAAHAECERLIIEGKGGTPEFDKAARRFHQLASQVGYPTAE